MIGSRSGLAGGYGFARAGLDQSNPAMAPERSALDDGSTASRQVRKHVPTRAPTRCESVDWCTRSSFPWRRFRDSLRQFIRIAIKTRHEHVPCGVQGCSQGARAALHWHPRTSDTHAAVGLHVSVVLDGSSRNPQQRTAVGSSLSVVLDARPGPSTARGTRLVRLARRRRVPLQVAKGSALGVTTTQPSSFHRRLRLAGHLCVLDIQKLLCFAVAVGEVPSGRRWRDSR